MIAPATLSSLETIQRVQGRASSSRWEKPSVATYPGWTRVTCTPWRASSICRASVQPARANLLAEYDPAPGRDTRPATLPPLTIPPGAQRRSSRRRPLGVAAATPVEGGGDPPGHLVQPPLGLDAEQQPPAVVEVEQRLGLAVEQLQPPADGALVLVLGPVLLLGPAGEPVAQLVLVDLEADHRVEGAAELLQPPL